MDSPTYKITRITNRDGEDYTDEFYTEFIGEEVKIPIMAENWYMYLTIVTSCSPLKDKTIQTSKVKSIQDYEDEIAITTENSVYYFKKVLFTETITNNIKKEKDGDYA